MPNASNYLKDKLARHVLLNTAYTSPPSVYMSLWTGNPTAAGTGPEIGSGVGYSRVLTPPATWGYSGLFLGWYAAAQIQFGPSTAAWGTVTHYGIHDAASGGNLLIFGGFTAGTVIVANQLLRIRGGFLEVLIQFA